MTACRPTADGDIVLTIEGAGGRGDCRAGAGVPAGRRGRWSMVRPEDVTLGAADSAGSGQLAWPGKVVDGIFRGPRRSLTVETAGLRFNVECPATRAAAVGETVTLLVDADNAWALRPDAVWRA